MPRERSSVNRLLIAGAALAGVFGSVAAAAEVGARPAITVREAPFAATIAAIDERWQISFRAARETRLIPAAELVTWGSPRELSNRPYVLLVDGSMLAAEELSSDQNQLRMMSELFGSISLPLEVVAGILYHPPLDARSRDDLLAELRGSQPPGDASDGAPAAAANADLLILENGDRLQGTIAKIAERKTALDASSGSVSIELDRVSAIRFNPSLSPPVRARGLRCLVGYSDGSLLTASKLVFDGRQSRLSLPCAVDLASESSTPEFLQPLGGRAVYLSDLPSESYLHIPYLALSWPYERDRSVSGMLLRASGRPYVKGIGMHSASRLTYQIDPAYRRFEAELAIDDDAAGRGSVIYRVFIDDREAYKSPIIRGGAAPTPVSIDLRSGKRLSLIIDFAERGDELDHADWLNARLVK